MAINVTAQTFDQEILKSQQPVVIDIFAPWCGPCRMMAPIFEELSKELGTQYKFAKLNIDEERDIAIQYNISSIPTFLFIKNGQLVGKEGGYMSADALKAKIAGLLG